MNRPYWVPDFLFLFAFSLVFLSCQSGGAGKELARDYYNVANAYAEQKKYDKAAEYYRRSLDLDPSLNEPAFNLARTYGESGEYEKALDLLRALAVQDEENLMVKEMQAYIYYRSGDAGSAADFYQQCLAVDPLHKRSLYNMALLSREDRDFSGAEAYLERLLKLEDKAEYRQLLAELEVLANEKGADDKAILEYENLVADGSGNAEVYGALKDLYLKRERYEDAVKMLGLLVDSASSESFVSSSVSDVSSGEASGEGNGDKPVDKPVSEKALLLWEKSRIELLFMEDFVNGRNDLKAALEGGFEKQGEIDALLKKLKPSWQGNIRSLVTKVRAAAEKKGHGKKS